MKIGQEVLKKIKPSGWEERRVARRVNRFLKKLNKKLTDASAIVGGSVAKGTWLSHKPDIDIFVLFNKDRNLSIKLKEILEKLFRKVELMHGSRDYFQVMKYGLIFEVIPVLKINKFSEAKNITDVSPLHVKWVTQHKNLIDQIRLCKKFCKAQGVYGAETYVKGFSGYALEILTIYYSSFSNLLKEAAKWKNGKIIYFNKPKKSLNKSKISPLILIDPVQDDRNVTAALSLEKFNKFISAAKLYIKKPSLEFFEEKTVKIKDLKDKDLILKVVPLKGKEDIVGTKLLKCFEYIKKKLEKEDFKVIDSNWCWNKDALFWFNLETSELPPYKRHYGPPINKKENLENFKKKWFEHSILQEKGRVYVKMRRIFVRANDYIRDLLTDPYIKERVKKIKIV